MQLGQCFLLLALVRSSLAVLCYDTRSHDFCCGDFCYSRRRADSEGQSYMSRSGCLQGSIYSGLKNKSWRDNSDGYTVCNTDLCNDDGVYQEEEGVYQEEEEEYVYQEEEEDQEEETMGGTKWPKSRLNCTESPFWAQEDCFACEQIAFTTKQTNRGCRYESTKGIDVIMQPQSCVRFQSSSTENYVECLCDTGNHCDRDLVKQQKLTSTTVTCAMGTYGNETCKGDFCYITKAVSIYNEEKGCITNNETLYRGLYKPDYFTFIDREYVVCATDKCNANWAKAKDSVVKIASVCVRPTTLSPSARIEDSFRSQWTNLMNSIRNAFSDVIGRFGGFHG
ncbi:hypothetical protein PRIPAC_78886 [Pristionchus pacificus]|uniref:DUF7622 domain-containing protein n=1 Tax=Pristionchus pacificus TaxID=54126 RepID=A0A2A6BX97_PRIPA|nr:hypothetical protein PRIPAC_78886 [Pristionchus pacificus]|eukprot:PDM70476.1 hypothetical protein PRIPAC_46722 [Pristionchus pacificus]